MHRIASTTAARAILVCLLLSSLPVGAQWTKVGAGIDYRDFRYNNDNDVFVARLDRSEPRAIIDTAVGKGSVASGLETVSSMAARTNGKLGYWGETTSEPYKVVAAVNGDYFSFATGIPQGGQIIGGWYAKRFNDWQGWSGFAWQLDRNAFIGECVLHNKADQLVRYGSGGTTQRIAGVNRERNANELVLYTSHNGATTGTGGDGSEVRVQMSRPTMILPEPAAASGTVVEVRKNKGSTPLSSGEVVLSASGTAGSTLVSKATVGKTIEISQSISACKDAAVNDWTKTYASVGGNWIFLKGGQVTDLTAKDGAVIVNPRTAICLNADYIFFLVVDGRSAQSKGMTMAELGKFCLDELGATDGINQDGGGSSTMWINGAIKNVPSDGNERAVANAIMMINVGEAPVVPDAAVVSDAATATDLGPVSDAATADHGTVDAGANEAGVSGDGAATESSSGCSCRLTALSADAGSLAWLLVLAALLRTARRREQRS